MIPAPSAVSARRRARAIATPAISTWGPARCARQRRSRSGHVFIDRPDPPFRVAAPYAVGKEVSAVAPATAVTS